MRKLQTIWRGIIISINDYTYLFALKLYIVLYRIYCKLLTGLHATLYKYLDTINATQPSNKEFQMKKLIVLFLIVLGTR